MTQWTFSAELWDWDATEATSTFLATPPEVDEEIRMTGGPPRGFGSVRVEATIGSSTWRTSVFPSTEHGFVLPVKKAVRTREGIEAGDVAEVTLRLLEE
ncbi:MAG TPA: DUF1905 domain-containing protein [Actinomycetales bacterium]|nr:DUF1905 domain-containing protein [Actinomycetales bacterium]